LKQRSAQLINCRLVSSDNTQTNSVYASAIKTSSYCIFRIKTPANQIISPGQLETA